LVLKADKTFLSILKAIDTRNPEMFPAIDEVLERLYAEDKNIFASTGGNTKVEEKYLRELGLSKFFRLIIGSDIASKHNHIEYFAEDVSMSVSEFASKTCSIGDGPTELMIASRFGIYSIGITNTLNEVSLSRVGAKRVVSSFSELLS
jgi:phosphoglycolate phosphatase-like HAD superfamily hydrolase